jgi:hypothetical protein
MTNQKKNEQPEKAVYLGYLGDLISFVLFTLPWKDD